MCLREDTKYKRNMKAATWSIDLAVFKSDKHLGLGEMYRRNKTTNQIKHWLLYDNQHIFFVISNKNV